MSICLHGVGASKGVSIGRLTLVRQSQLRITEHQIDDREIEAEVARFERALKLARADLQRICDQLPKEGTADAASLLNVHLLMLNDSSLTEHPIAIVRERRCSAQWALKLQRDTITAVFDAIDEPYLHNRKEDVDHVVEHIQRILADDEVQRPLSAVDHSRVAGRIVFADDLSPADAVLMHQQNVAALLTGYGGITSHTAILARGLQIPAVVGLNQARSFLQEDDEVIVDGHRGVVIIAPNQFERAYYTGRLSDSANDGGQREKLLAAPVVTRDGQHIVLQANVELSSDLTLAQSEGADGIGLYRSESLFMNRTDLPEEEEQFSTYVHALRAMRGLPVTIRTVDVGADKQVDGIRPGAPATLNPALGLRAIRLCLREPALFRPQLLAILRASAFGPMRMMIPMISTPQELVQIKTLLDDCRRELAERRIAFNPSLPLGAMIEVPAAALCADIFARHLDFLSIGTNDLIQYTIAVDRIDDEVNYLYNPLHPAVLRLIRMTIRAGERAGVPVSMCGEMAGDTRVTRLLLGMGLKDFSVHPSVLLEIKQIVSESHLPELRRLAKRVLRTTRASTRETLIEEMNHDRVA